MTSPSQSLNLQKWHPENEDHKEQSKKPKTGWPFMRLVIFVLLLSILFISATRLIEQYTAKSFPDLPAGKYLGAVDGENTIISKGTKVYLERESAEDPIYLTLVDSNSSRTIKIILDYSTLQSDGSLSAVTTSIDGSHIKLTGGRGKQHDYAGTIVEAATGVELNWYFNSVFVREDTSDYETKLKKLLALNADRILIEERVASQQQELERSKTDAIMITSYAAGEASGAELLNDELAKIDKLISESRQEIKDLEISAKNFQKKIELSKKISPRGRLVSLTRETLERDQRWAASRIKNAKSQETQIHSRYQEALHIKALLDRIAVLENSLQDLQGNQEGFSSPSLKDDEVYWLNYE